MSRHCSASAYAGTMRALDPTPIAVRRAYDQRAVEYAEHFADVATAHPDDRAHIRAWALARSGPVLDAGCGPGHWTEELRQHRVDVEGIDHSPEFLAIAESRFPDARFRQASLEQTGCADASLDGVLAWYSVIHTRPEELAAVLAEFRRVLRPGGSLLVGLFAWSHLETFEHAVIRAYRWPSGQFSRVLHEAGFSVLSVTERHEPGARPQCIIEARRSPDVAPPPKT